MTTYNYARTELLLKQTMAMVGLLLHRLTFDEAIQPAERDEAKLLLAAYKQRSV